MSQQLNFLHANGYRIEHVDTDRYILWFGKLKIDTCQSNNPDQATKEFYIKATDSHYDSKIKGPILVSVAVLRHPMTGKYCLGRRTNIEELNLFGFPGGKVAVGETSEDACYRELKEECGVIAESSIYLGHIDEFIHRHFHCDLFLVSNWIGEVTNMEPTKCICWEWYIPYYFPVEQTVLVQEMKKRGYLHKCEVLMGSN